MQLVTINSHDSDSAEGDRLSQGGALPAFVMAVSRDAEPRLTPGVDTREPGRPMPRAPMLASAPQDAITIRVRYAGETRTTALRPIARMVPSNDRRAAAEAVVPPTAAQSLGGARCWGAYRVKLPRRGDANPLRSRFRAPAGLPDVPGPRKPCERRMLDKQAAGSAGGLSSSRQRVRCWLRR